MRSIPSSPTSTTAVWAPRPYPVIQRITQALLDVERVSESLHHRVAPIRKRACAFFGCDLDELAFNRSTTEGINLVAQGLSLKPGDEVLMSSHEHPGGAMAWLLKAEKERLTIRLFEPGRSAEETFQRVEAAMTPKTRVFMMSHVTCTLGQIAPVRALSRLCRDRDIYSVFDGAQAPGMITVDFHNLECDFYATSGHKWLLGPKGTGILCVRRDVMDRWSLTQVGAYSDKGYSLERRELTLKKTAEATEYGTRNTPLVEGLGAALDYLAELGVDHITARDRYLAARVRKGLLALPGLEILTPEDPAEHAGIVTFRPKDKKSNPFTWIHRLRKDYRIRLRPVGEHGLDAIRVSTHFYNQPDEVDRMLHALGEVMRT